MRAACSGLPQAFCWTRFGSEAGEGIGAILDRKESERRATGGTFYWGIGNSVGPGVAQLLKSGQEPFVLFSPIKGKPRPEDVDPVQVVRWRRATALDGASYDLPNEIEVTSRRVESRSSHYALVCCSDEPLVLADHGRVSIRHLMNIRSGRAIGASQVTAVVRHDRSAPAAPSDYVVALMARLVPPYFVRLTTHEATEARDELLQLA